MHSNFPAFTAEPKSKRSGKVRLSSMVATIGAAALVSGCGEEAPKPAAKKLAADPSSQVQAYENIFECAKLSSLSQQECSDARSRAIATSEETAPRFEAQYDCEADFGEGNCVKHKGEGRSFFSPFVAGFFLGKMLEGKRDSAPLFRSKGDQGFTTANGYRLGYGGSPGKYIAVGRAMEKASKVTAIKAASSAASRGGFTMASVSNGWNRKPAKKAGG